MSIEKSEAGLHFPAGVTALKSEAMQSVYERVKRLRWFEKLPVLLLGPTGSGKDAIARLIHENSDRKGKVFLTVNCSHFRGETLRSELFGYVRGAFTGADEKGKDGIFEQAAGGVLFLDEIAEIPLEYQADLLRAIENQEIRRISGNKTIKVDARVIAATNVDLEERVKAGLFREDLYYRLKTYPIEIPQLQKQGVPVGSPLQGVSTFQDTTLARAPETAATIPPRLIDPYRRCVQNRAHRPFSARFVLHLCALTTREHKFQQAHHRGGSDGCLHYNSKCHTLPSSSSCTSYIIRARILRPTPKTLSPLPTKSLSFSNPHL